MPSTSSTSHRVGPILICLGACAAPAAPSATPAGGAPPPSVAAAPAPALAFPTLATRDLNGTAQRVPDGLSGELKLFLIAFQREQQADIDPWLTLALRLERAHPGFRVYELPTLSLAWSAAGSFIDDGMRRGIPDPEARARTLTLYVDKDRFRQALALPGEEQVYALLVDAAGDVVWRSDGQLDDASGATMAAEVERRLGG